METEKLTTNETVTEKNVIENPEVESIGPYSSDESIEEFSSIVSEEEEYEKIVVAIKRVAKVLKGGKKLSFYAMVVVGNKKGLAGYASGKANEVPAAIVKATKKAMKNLFKIPIVGTTIPHQIIGKQGRTKVLLKPARPGTGVIAGTTVRAVMTSVGINDILTKIIGSTNPINVVPATFKALRELRTKEVTTSLRQQ
ncbi:MAG: 30S ribosomal protein S5 [Endomicrobiia bacterium]